MTPAHLVILGGTGFVGRHLLARACAAGLRVTVLSRHPDRHPDLLVPHGARVQACDVYDAARLSAALHGADVVVNLIGILNERGRDGRGFERAHVQLTRTLVAACAAAGVRRLLQMSALNAGRGRSHYLRTRGEAEAVVRESGLEWTLFQPSVIFGPGDGLFTRFATLLRMTPVLPLARAGTKFAPVYVGDVASALLRAARDRSCIGQTYELYGPDTLTLAEIVRYTAGQLGLRRVVLPLPDAAARLQALVCDFVPGKPFSTDNFLSLLTDSVGGIDGLYRLGLPRTPIATIVPGQLARTPRQRRLDAARARRSGPSSVRSGTRRG